MREEEKSLIIELASKSELETLSDAFRTERTEVETKAVYLLPTEPLLTGWVYTEHSEKIENILIIFLLCGKHRRTGRK